jgi:hypothetical protein
MGNIKNNARERKEEETKQIEEIKMLSEIYNESSINLDTCTLNELLTMLQKYAKDPSMNMHQQGFGSYIVDLVIKEKIDIYNK